MDTSVVLDEYVILAESIRQSTIGSLTIDFTEEDISNKENQDISDVLSEEAGIYIKGYGLGSLSTSSIRGGSAGHTLVLWNGVPLQSPLLGLLDLSLLSTNSFEEIKISKGGQSAMWGSGAIGGVISLKNRQDQNDMSLHIHSRFGSFGQRDFDSSIGFRTGKFVSRTSFNIKAAENDFTYLLSDGISEREQSNAQLKKLDLQQDLYFTLNPENQISIHYWHQNTHRHIPPTTVQTFSEAFQDDKAHRLIATWQRATANNSFQFRVARIQEELNYFDPFINLISPSEFLNIIIDTDYLWKSAIGTIGIGASQFYTTANAAGFMEDIDERKSALFLSYLFSTDKIQLQTSVRQEWLDGDQVPFIPSVGVNIDLAKTWEANVKISRNYRLPTLNDRFWRPGGNTTLQAESGWSQEASLIYNNDDDNPFQFSVTGFSRQIEDWILWALVEEQSYFSANNISKVWSRGSEVRSSYTYYFGETYLQLKAGYDFTKSTNEILIDQPALEKGEQLLYTPLHQGFLQAEIQWNSFNLNYHHRFIGDAIGINEDIKRFHVSNIRLQTNINIDQVDSMDLKAKVYVSIHNLFNRNYRVIERRPMPGRYLSVGIKVDLQK